MQCRRSLLVAALLLANCAMAFAQADASRQKPTRILRNNDVLRMHKDGINPADIVVKIVTSPCAFDIFPPVMRDLQRRGVPDTVLMAMTRAPYGPPSTTVADNSPSPPQTTRVHIPAGTVVEVELASPVSSADVEKGSRMTFLVSRPVFVKDVLVIARGARARGRVVKIKRAGAWGRGGTLDWTMEDVVAVDGTRVPIKFSDRVTGTNRTKAVVAAAIVTGALGFPYSPPIAMVWGLKKGEEAVIYGNKRSSTVVGNRTEVAGSTAKKKKRIYHSVGNLKSLASSRGSSLPPFNNSFRPTPIRHR